VFQTGTKGNLEIHGLACESLPVYVESAWSDEIEVCLYATLPGDINIDVKSNTDDFVKQHLMSILERRESDGTVVIDVDDASQSFVDAIEILMPEQYGINIHTNGPIEIRGKVEGDVTLMSTNSNINCDKIRGERVDIQACAGKVVIKTLEGQETSVTASDVAIAKMMGDKIIIESTEGGIVANAIYAQDAKLKCGGAGGLTLGSMHGKPQHTNAYIHS
jgi:hypothetical protein